MKTHNIIKTNFKFTKIFALILLSTVGFSLSASAEEDSLVKVRQELNELKAKMQDAEIRESGNIFKWSGVLINRFDYMDNNYNNDGTYSSNYANFQSQIRDFGTFMSLNNEAEVNERVTFYSAIGMSKFWNQDGRTEGSADYTTSQTSSYGYAGAIPRIDKAFFTYRFEKPFTISIGRMPTNNGPPAEQQDGLARQGTYPRFAYNAIFDGAALTYDFRNMVKSDQSLVMRLFFTPFVNASHADRTLNLQDTANTSGTGSGQFAAPFYQQFALLTEYDLKGLSWVDDLAMEWMSYEYTNDYNTGFGYSTSPTGSTGYNTADTSGNNKNWLNARVNMLYLGFDGVMKTGLNINLSWLSAYGYFTNNAVGTPLSYTSNAYLIDTNYKFQRFDHPVIGMEYIKTDAAYYLDDNTSLDIVPFHTNGNTSGTHLYMSRPLGYNFTARVGYYHTNTVSSPLWNIYYSDKTAWYTQLRLDF